MIAGRSSHIIIWSALLLFSKVAAHFIDTKKNVFDHWAYYDVVDVVLSFTFETRSAISLNR